MQRLQDRWLYLLMTVFIIILVLAFRNAWNSVPQRILVDVEVQEKVDKYLKHDKPNKFVGVEEFKIILRVTEKGE